VNAPRTADEIRRALRSRAISAKRWILNVGKHAHRASPVQSRPLTEAAGSCATKADFLRADNDAVWRMAEKQIAPTSNAISVSAGPDVENRSALEASLAEASFETPAIVFGRFRGCVAEPHSIRLVTGDGILIPETAAIHDQLDSNYLDSAHLLRRKGQLRYISKNYSTIEADVIFAFNSFSSSFGHYLLTSLPIVLSFRDEIKDGFLKAVVPPDLPEWMTRHLLELGIEERSLLRIAAAPHRFRSAIVSNILDASNTRAPNPNTIGLLRSLIENAPRPDSRKRKIYVKRSSSGNLSSRTISNEADVIDAMTRTGFDIVEPAKMTLIEQVRAFDQADIVVSAHGSTLANLVFCRPNTRVLDLMPDSWVGIRGDTLRDVWASRLCSLLGLEYSVLLTPSKVLRKHFTGNPTIVSDVPVSELVDIARSYE
jgi:capsular polysaccharide biosynthesis protein